MSRIRVVNGKEVDVGMDVIKQLESVIEEDGVEFGRVKDAVIVHLKSGVCENVEKSSAKKDISYNIKDRDFHGMVKCF